MKFTIKAEFGEQSKSVVADYKIEVNDVTEEELANIKYSDISEKLQNLNKMILSTAKAEFENMRSFSHLQTMRKQL